jgi:hypothetical protein
MPENRPQRLEAMTFAPIALFVYNRLSHSRQTIEALQKNSLSRDSDLFVFSDAPKSAAQTEAVREVRQYIRQIDGFKSVTIVERETNWGLARSIIEGVTTLCEKYGRAIVMEDDLVTSPHFLKFMNDALDIYKHENRVMHISGSTYPIENIEDETFFLRVPLCWGWATWDRAWHHFRKSNDVMLEFDRKMRKDFSFNHSYHYWNQLESNKKGLINTWFIYWYATLFLRKGLALFPGKSLVRNIGMDGTGVHCGVNRGYDFELTASTVNVLTIPLVESAKAVRLHESFFLRDMPRHSLHARICGKIFRIIKKLGLVPRIVGEGKQ